MIMIEKLTKHFDRVFKYRNSLIFKHLYFNEANPSASLKTKDNVPIAQKDNTNLGKLLEVTKLDLEKFKRAIEDANYYNMCHYLYNVNDFLTDLLDKNKILKNYIDLVIADLVREEIFRDLTDKKIERILSLFSEINCIGNLVSGKPKFVISPNKDKEYKKDGRFDLVITKNNLSYYFDVERINSLPIEKLDSVEIENKIKDKIYRIVEKGTKENINRPLFLLLDVSDWAWLETKEEDVFKVGWVGDEIFKILNQFFNKNGEAMPAIQNIAGVGLFYSLIGVTNNKKDLAYIFWHQGYTNKNHKFLSEKNQIIELNNLIFDKLKEEQEKIISKYGDSRFELL